MNNKVICVKNFLCLGIALGSFSLSAMDNKKGNVLQLTKRFMLERTLKKEQENKKRKLDDETQQRVNKKYTSFVQVHDKSIEQNVSLDYASFNSLDSVFVELQQNNREL